MPGALAVDVAGASVEEEPRTSPGAGSATARRPGACHRLRDHPTCGVRWSAMSSAGTGDEAVLAFTKLQLERELNARQQVARGAGLALIELSAILEEQHAILDRSVDPLGIVLVAYAARGRRLLRAAYRLLDAGDVAEAVPC